MNLECKINYYVNNVDGESVKTSKTVLVMDPANYTEAETLAMKHTSVIEKRRRSVKRYRRVLGIPDT